MRRTIACMSLVAVLALYGSALAIPNDEYDDSESHPLRTAAYLLNPVGVGLEYVLYRPFHWLVSRNETTELIFGHRPHGAEELQDLACNPIEVYSCSSASMWTSPSMRMSTSSSAGTRSGSAY
jgi:hypothetical protein